MKKAIREQLDFLELDTKRKIADFVHDCTVGAGNDSHGPNAGQLELLSEVLQRSLTLDDRRIIREEWDRCVQMMAQP
jgi:hypothetical protein